MNCINLVKQRLLTVQTPEMTRATQAFLSSMSKYHVSLGPWSVGIDKESSDILFSVPADSLKFVSGNFLKSLRCSWIESGFTIVEEAEVVGYKCEPIVKLTECTSTIGTPEQLRMEHEYKMKKLQLNQNPSMRSCALRVS